MKLGAGKAGAEPPAGARRQQTRVAAALPAAAFDDARTRPAQQQQQYGANDADFELPQTQTQTQANGGAQTPAYNSRAADRQAQGSSSSSLGANQSGATFAPLRARDTYDYQQRPVQPAAGNAQAANNNALDTPSPAKVSEPVHGVSPSIVPNA